MGKSAQEAEGILGINDAMAENIKSFPRKFCIALFSCSASICYYTYIILYPSVVFVGNVSNSSNFSTVGNYSNSSNFFTDSSLQIEEQGVELSDVAFYGLWFALIEYASILIFSFIFIIDHVFIKVAKKTACCGYPLAVLNLIMFLSLCVNFLASLVFYPAGMIM